MDIYKLFYDLETTGIDPMRNSIHQISGIIEVNGKIEQEFDIKTKPHPKAEYNDTALKKCKVTREQLESYQDMKGAYLKLTSFITTYIDKYSKTEKFFLIGFNNLSFDDIFLRVWFEQNKDPFFNSYFFPGSIDCISLASEYLIRRRRKMPSFKLVKVAKTLGIQVNEEKLHNASYDVHLNRKIYRIVTGRDIEI